MQMYCNDGIKKKNHFCGQQSHAISFTSTPNNCAAWLGTWSKNFAGGKLKGGHTNTLIIIMWQRWKTLWGRVLSNFNITNGMYHDKWIFQKIPFLNWIPSAMLSYLNVKGIFIWILIFSYYKYVDLVMPLGQHEVSCTSYKTMECKWKKILWKVLGHFFVYTFYCRSICMV